MTGRQGVPPPEPELTELELLRREHDNVVRLLLVLESDLAVMSTGDECDAGLMLDTVRYLIDYIGRFHREDGEELCRRLEAAIGDNLLDRQDLVHLGFSYCAALRRSMLLEEKALADAREAVEDDAALDEVRSAAFEDHRAHFEELTHRIGCDCEYTRTR